MQILIAARGVTPNSVEINTNCIPAGCCFRARMRITSLRLIAGETLYEKAGGSWFVPTAIVTVTWDHPIAIR